MSQNAVFHQTPCERPYDWLLSPNAASSGWPEWHSSTGAISRSHYNSRRTVGGGAMLHCVFVQSGDEVWISLFSLSHFDLTLERDS